ncbi:MAG: nitroreductase family protein [Myxococcales bacterium]|nr:nitroreductase family protein [Myxococcales bacterium]
MGRLIDALMREQEHTGFLATTSLTRLGEELSVPLYRLEELVSFYPHFRRTPPARVHLAVCRDVVCRMAATDEHRAAIAALASSDGDVELHEVSCLGRCDAAPAASVGDCPVAARDLLELTRALASPAQLDTVLAPPRRWSIDPYATATSASDGTQRYGTVRALIRDGFDASALLATLGDSGLRGMGGAGFPTASKWKMVRGQPGRTKYVICNADESEPGTFKDRVILADLSHLVIEGMLLAALTVGAHEGIVFIRHEYAPERLRLVTAIEEARRAGVLGPDACGSGHAFDVRVAVSPGGYILGEETALLECLEDRRGEPRNKPPFPGQAGLFGEPTLINNVETFALVPAILHGGAEAWKARGVRGASGTKMISISGDVAVPDVYEIPMGTSVLELIERAGGMRDGQALYGFLPGGASSNFLAAKDADVALDFEALKERGSMLGSGAVVVFARGRDIVELAHNLVAFFRNESCGKCVPCRIGSEKAVHMLEAAVAHRGSRKHLALLPELASTMAQTSICGLGQVALNPFTSALQQFDGEVRARFTTP